MLAASQNRGPLRIFEVKKNIKQLDVLPDDVTAMIILANNKTQRQELNYGASFLSQSARYIAVPAGAKRVIIRNSKGVQRTVNL